MNGAGRAAVRARGSRLAVVLGSALLLVVLGASPALAHTRASSATNFDSRIEATPDLPGVAWRVYPGGEYLEVRNTSAVPLVVLGYEGEPYLRIGPAGVERNRNSPATYLNEERYADVAVPPRADAGAAPGWERLSDVPRHAWHDHRIHWMAPTLPATVAAAPEAPQRLHSWSVPFTYDRRSLEVTGALHWVPGTPWWSWLAAGLVLTAPAAAALRHRGPAALRPAAATVAVVGLVNLAHLPDEVVALPVPLLDVVFGILHNVLFIGVGLAGAALAWRGVGARPVLALGAGAVLFHQGLLQVSQLGASQLATVWPPAVIRLLVAASIGQAIWTAVVIAAHRTRPAAAAGRAERRPAPADPVRAEVGRR